MPAPDSSVPATLTATAINRVRGERTILRDVSLTVAPGTCLGVVGANGVGKSTLLRILAGLELADAGVVGISPPDATVGYLAQEPDRNEAESVRQKLHRVTGVADAEEQLQSAADALGRGDPGASDHYATALQRWQALGAPDVDARVEAVLDDLGLARELAELPTAVLSGGQAARVELAAVLVARFDIVLLDEPTNDLDFDGLARLERFVAERRGGLAVVSHDRSFLANTVTAVLEIDEHDHGARQYNGGWAAYLEERATARRHAQEAYADYQARRRQLLDRSRRERQWATTGVARERRRADNDKAQRDFRLNRTEQLASRARRTERALERLDVVDKPWEGWDLQFTIASAPRAGRVVARLDQAVVRRGTFSLGPLDLEIGWGERLRIAGRNGSGKTTLVGALLGHFELASGQRYVGPGVVAGQLGQDRQALSGSASLLDAFIARTGLDVTSARSLLAKFGLGAHVVTSPGRSLSPGERTRSELAVFQASGVNLLVLDEPTNHLDLPAVEQLEEALSGYPGTLVLVTHDRSMLETVDVTRTFDLGI